MKEKKKSNSTNNIKVDVCMNNICLWHIRIRKVLRKIRGFFICQSSEYVSEGVYVYLSRWSESRIIMVVSKGKIVMAYICRLEEKVEINWAF